jgi:hypothetical protein
MKGKNRKGREEQESAERTELLHSVAFALFSSQVKWLLNR